MCSAIAGEWEEGTKDSFFRASSTPFLIRFIAGSLHGKMNLTQLGSSIESAPLHNGRAAPNSTSLFNELL